MICLVIYTGTKGNDGRHGVDGRRGGDGRGQDFAAERTRYDARGNAPVVEQKAKPAFRQTTTIEGNRRVTRGAGVTIVEFN